MQLPKALPQIPMSKKSRNRTGCTGSVSHRVRYIDDPFISPARIRWSASCQPSITSQRRKAFRTITFIRIIEHPTVNQTPLIMNGNNTPHIRKNSPRTGLQNLIIDAARQGINTFPAMTILSRTPNSSLYILAFFP